MSAFQGAVSTLRTLRFGASSSEPRFLLLHGNPGTADDFERLGPLLGRCGVAVAPDLPGFGESAPFPSDLSGSALDAHADACAALLDELGWRSPITVIGHSHGGGVAQVLAGRHPRRVRSLVLLGSLGHPAHLSYRLLAAPFAAGFLAASTGVLSRRSARWARRRLVEIVGMVGFSPDRAEAAWLARFEKFLDRPEGARWMARLAREGPSSRLHTNAPSVRCPVLLIHGAMDRVVPLRFGQGLHEVLCAAGADCQLEVLPRSGHMLTHRNAQEIATRIELWLQRQRGAA